jgi:MFS family permease
MPNGGYDYTRPTHGRHRCCYTTLASTSETPRRHAVASGLVLGGVIMSARTLPAAQPRLFSRPFTILLAVLFANGVLSAPARSLLPLYVEGYLQQPLLLASWLRAIEMIMGGLFALVGGALCDRLGRKPTLVLGLTGPAVAGVAYLTGSPLLLCLFWLYAGLAFGLQSTGSQTYLMGAVQAGRLGIGTALFFLGNTLGNSLGNIYAGRVVDRYGFLTLAALVVAANSVITLVAAYALPALPVDRTVRGVPLRRVFLGYGDLLRRREVQLLGIMRYLPTFYWGTATLLIPQLIFRLRAHSAAAALDYSAASLLVAAAVQLLTGRVLDRAGTRRPAAVAATAVTLCALGTAVWGHELWGLYVFGIAGAAAAWSLSTAMPPLINELAGPAEKGRLMALTHLLWSAGMLSGSVAGGALDAVGPSGPMLAFAIVGGLNLITVVVAWSLALGKAEDAA